MKPDIRVQSLCFYTYICTYKWTNLTCTLFNNNYPLHTISSTFHTLSIVILISPNMCAPWYHAYATVNTSGRRPCSWPANSTAGLPETPGWLGWTWQPPEFRHNIVIPRWSIIYKPRLLSSEEPKQHNLKQAKIIYINYILLFKPHAGFSILLQSYV